MSKYTRELERMRQEGEQLLAWRVQDIIVGLGLTQADYSMGGGRTLHIPEVVSVTERPVGLDIRMLPGQIPDDFAAHAKRFAYNLGVSEVRVVPLGPSLIRLILVPKANRSSGNGDTEPDSTNLSTSGPGRGRADDQQIAGHAGQPKTDWTSNGSRRQRRPSTATMYSNHST